VKLTVPSPYAHAEFSVGDTQSLLKKYPGLERVLSAADVPGHNGFGIYPDIKDQPVLAAGRVLFRGEAVLALVGDRECVEAIAHEELPLSWTELPVIDKVAAALADGADLLHKDRSNNVLIKGRVRKGDDACFNESANSELKYASGEWETAFVEPYRLRWWFWRQARCVSAALARSCSLGSGSTSRHSL